MHKRMENKRENVIEGNETNKCIKIKGKWTIGRNDNQIIKRRIRMVQGKNRNWGTIVDLLIRLTFSARINWGEDLPIREKEEKKREKGRDKGTICVKTKSKWKKRNWRNKRWQRKKVFWKN